MLVEVHGAGFANKGAELMLRVAVDELRKRLPQLTPSIDPLYGSYTSRCDLGLWQIFPPRTHVGSKGFSERFRKQKCFALLQTQKIFNYLSGTTIDAYGLVRLSEVDALIDISGFAYSDQWGCQPTIDLAALTRYYHRHHKKVILLPQAFGPFEQPEIKAAFSEVLNNSDLVFPRDKQSWDYVAALSAHPERLFLAPDITLFYHMKLETRASIPHYVCIVPNNRLLDQGKNEWGNNKYEEYIYLMVMELIKQGIQVKVVIHDTSGGDIELAERICLNAPSVEIIQETDPIILKSIIGQSLFLIGSRYHSLVGAFSYTVPSICLGWSHKYQMLFDDFGCGHCVISSDCAIETVLGCIHELVDPVKNTFYREKISHKLKELISTNTTMWNRVTELLTMKSVSESAG